MVNMESCLQGHIAQRERCSHLGTGEVIDIQRAGSGIQRAEISRSYKLVKEHGKEEDVGPRIEKKSGVNDKRGDPARP